MNDVPAISETAPAPELIAPTLIEVPAASPVLPVLVIEPVPIEVPAAIEIRPFEPMLPEEKDVPAAAWRLPAEIGPLIVIEPRDATGTAPNTSSGSKSSLSPPPPASMNIDESAR